MKKILIGTLALGLLAMVSCKKTNTVNGGSWTFKSANYSVSSAISSTTDNALTAISTSGNKYDELQFTFYTLPSTSGTYTVTSGAPDSTNTQIGVYMKLATAPSYAGPEYTPSAGTTATATVSMVNGLAKVTLSSVDMVNIADATDHSSLTATINQTEH